MFWAAEIGQKHKTRINPMKLLYQIVVVSFSNKNLLKS